MAKMTEAQLRAILSAEKQAALSADSASKLTDDRQRAMDYYNGDMSGDMPVPDGKSSAVSTDVSDTIEGLMPSLMEIFAGSDEVVKFDPVGPEDVEAAEQETDYINHVFMQQNPGFMVLYSFIKDALLSKNGYVKVWWEREEREERETLYDQPDDVVALLASDPEVEIVEHTPKPMEGYEPGDDPEAQPPMLHDITIAKTKEYECARVEGVPPEEIGVGRNTRDIKNATYVYHETIQSQAELIAQGFDEEQIESLPTYGGIEGNSEERKRDTVDETNASEGDHSLNRSQRQIKTTEHYIRMDYDGTGKPALYQVVTGGEQGEILKRDGELAIERFTCMPFAAMTPIIVTHRHYGRSVADLVMDIQRIKTALMRGMLDNLYLHNNPRVEVAQSHAGPNTLDDLLVSRPGGVVRTKTPGGVAWQVVPDITGSVYPALEYLDATREWRTGVTRQGQGIDANALQNQSATAVNQAFTAAQARMKLIARIFAETGIRDLFTLLHQVIRQNGSVAQTARLRKKWVQVDPRNWKSRNDMTVHVGLGNGGKEQQLAMMQLLIGAQEKAIGAGLVSKRNLWNSAQELVKLLGRKDPESFFTAPDAQPDQKDPASAPIEPPQDPKLIELQAKNEIEKTQAQADIATQRDKTQMEAALQQQKFQMEASMKREEHAMKMQEMRLGMAAKLASSASNRMVGPDGQVQESGPSVAEVMAMVDQLNQHEKPGKSVMRKVADGIYEKEETKGNTTRKTRMTKQPDGSWLTEHTG